MAYVNPINQALYASIVTGLTGVVPNVVSIGINDIPTLEALSGILAVYPANTSATPLHVTLDSTIVTVSGVVSSGLPSPTVAQTIINYVDTQTGNSGAVSYASQTATLLRTVTNGKKFYMTGIQIAGDAGLELYVSLSDNATQIWGTALNENGTSYVIGDYKFPTPLVFSTSVKFTQWKATAVSMQIAFQGFEQ